MYSARDRIEHDTWLGELEEAAERLELGTEARSCAADLFLSNVPDAERSKPAVLAASLYAGSLVAGESRPQGEVASAVGVSRLAVQRRWKSVLESAGLEPPGW